MNIENYIDAGFSLKDINTLKKYEEKGYDVNVVLNYRNELNLKEVLKELLENNVKNSDVSLFLTLKAAGAEDKELFDVVLNSKYDNKFKLQVVELSRQTDSWKDYIKNDISISKLKNINRLLREGLDEEYVKNTDVSKNDVLKYREMKEDVEKNVLFKDFDLDSFIKKRIPISMIYKYFNAYFWKVDLDYFIKDKSYRPEQIDKIIEMVAKDKTICTKYKDIFFKEKFEPKTMEKMLVLYKEGFPVEILDDNRWNNGQLTVLKMIFHKTKTMGVDIKKFLHPDFKATQFEAIYSALLRNLDVDVLLEKAYSEKRLRNLLDVLSYNKNNPDDLLDIEYFKNPKVPDYLLTSAVAGMNRSHNKLETKLKFYKQFDEELSKDKEKIIEEVR